MRSTIAFPTPDGIPSSHRSIEITTLQLEVRRASEKGHKRSARRRATKAGRVSTGKDFHPLFFAVEEIMPSGSSKSPQPSLCSR